MVEMAATAMHARTAVDQRTCRDRFNSECSEGPCNSTAQKLVLGIALLTTWPATPPW
eukprot:CAMPEP_0172709022 /NCGR_PEP_ID=MMETSP1074-20121228/53106_1 /TAXON_ID=2916 /ORGANISM="Ceratium fusus, Strain PA161109" /LENGTH=56 /DNA_ID=CAMNT_0013532147 /DNA_START=149 /DNA_END=316 /DNA_ORIENTATION=-